MEGFGLDLRVPFAFFFIVGLLVGVGGCALMKSGWLPTVEIHWTASEKES